GKLRYCDCVVEKFQEALKADAALLEAHNAFTAKYIELKSSPRETSRVLASNHQENFSSGIEKLDVLFSSLDLRYPFGKLKDEVKPLGESLDTHWNASMRKCAQSTAPVAEIQP